jgi:diguanylate cyclase (GGDEF)-like protein
MHLTLENFFTSGFDFSDAESITKHRYRLLNAILLITVVATFCFGLLSDIGFHDMGHFSIIEYLVSGIAFVLILVLRRSKHYYYIVAYLLFAVAFVLFTAALIFVRSDEFRIVWFLLLVFLSYMLVGRFAGHLATILSIFAIITVHHVVDIGISTLAINTALLSIIIGSLMASSYTSKVHAYEIELHEKNLELEVLATTDSLTGIYNRRAFTEIGKKYLESARRSQGQLSFLMLDIDHFKEINDSHGHQVGDVVLINFSRQIQALLRKSDIYGRLGGEEFGVLLFDTDVRQAELLAERIRKHIAVMETHVEEKRLSITVSIGVSCLERGTHDTLRRLENRADEALYTAKESGRNRIAIK